ncbi:MAG: DNA/RNA nuclease SfsA [Anaerolineae bacterium]
MRFDQLVEGQFIRRENRFLATVRLGGGSCGVHVASSGRMRELLVAGARVWLRPASRTGRKTAYDLALVEHGDTLVSVDARLPNRLYSEAWHRGAVLGGGHGRLVQERTRGASRLDFCAMAAESRRWIEVKSVTLVRDGVALFPDAPTTRGTKHLLELADARADGASSAVVFLVQRSDATLFAPNWEADSAFSETLLSATRRGVVVEAYVCQVSLRGVAINKPLPIALGLAGRPFA